METNELTKKAIQRIHETECFTCSLSAYGGGACGDGWDGTEDLYLNRAKILYLLFKQEEVNGEKTESVNIENLLSGMAYEGAWPDGEPDEEDEDISSYSYSGESESLDNYLNSWKTVLKKIESGEINETNLEEWLCYFDDSSNLDDNIEFWVKWKK